MKKVLLFMILITMTIGLFACIQEDVVEDLPTVTLSPTGSDFDGDVTVTITATDADTVYYSYDGETYLTYTEALVITETTTVYAKAENSVGFSEVVEQTYTKHVVCDGTLVDGICITGDQEALYLSMVDLQAQDQFQIAISIDDSQLTVLAEIVYDGLLSAFRVGDEEVIYEVSGDVLNSYTKLGDSYLLTTSDVTTNDQLFFLALTYDQFSFSNEQYLLKYSEYSMLDGFVSSLVLDGTTSNFALSIHDGQIAEMAFDITVSLTVYHVQLTFSYEAVDLVVPTNIGGSAS